MELFKHMFPMREQLDRSLDHTIESVHQTKKMILCMVGKGLCYRLFGFYMMQQEEII